MGRDLEGGGSRSSRDLDQISRVGGRDLVEFSTKYRPAYPRDLIERSTRPRHSPSRFCRYLVQISRVECRDMVEISLAQQKHAAQRISPSPTNASTHKHKYTLTNTYTMYLLHGGGKIGWLGEAPLPLCWLHKLSPRYHSKIRKCMCNAIFVLFYLHTIELVGKLVLSGAVAFPCNATAPFDLANHT